MADFNIDDELYINRPSMLGEREKKYLGAVKAGVLPSLPQPGEIDEIEKKTRRAQILNAIFSGVSGLGDIGVFGTKGRGEGPKSQFGRTLPFYERLSQNINKPLEEAKARQSQSELLKANLIDKLNKKNEEEEEIQRKHHIEGFRYTSKAIQSDAAIRESRDKVAATGNLIEGMEDLKKEILKTKSILGTNMVNPLSEEGRIIQQRLMAMFGDLKDYLELGVLQQADEQLMRRMIPDVTKLSELFKAGKVENLLSDMQKVWAKGTKNKLKGLGWGSDNWLYEEYTKDKKSNNRIQVVSPDGTVGDIPELQLKEALKEGYKRVN